MVIKAKLTSDNGNDIKLFSPVESMFPNAFSIVQYDGSLCNIVHTEILPHVTYGKSKRSSLMPVLNFIAKDWGLNLSKSHDCIVAERIILNSIKKN